MASWSAPLLLVALMLLGAAAPLIGGDDGSSGASRDAPLEMGQSGFWNISAPVSYRNQTIRSLGDVTILDGGALMLENATLLMAKERATITVAPGGALDLMMGATIAGALNTSSNITGTTYRYCLLVEEGGKLMVEDGSILGTGWANGTTTQGGVVVRSSDVMVQMAMIDGWAYGMRIEAQDPIRLSWSELMAHDQNMTAPALIAATGTEVHLLDSPAAGAMAEPGGTIVIEHEIDIDVQNGHMRSLQGADVRIVTGGKLVYATEGFGGTDPRTAVHSMMSGMMGEMGDMGMEGMDMMEMMPGLCEEEKSMMEGMDHMREMDEMGMMGESAHACNPVIVTGAMVDGHDSTNVTTTVTARYASWSQTVSTNVNGSRLMPLMAHLPTSTFSNVAAAAGVAQSEPPFDSSQAIGPLGAWADYDGDGLLDLYATGRVGVEMDLPASRSHLYHNDGDGTFSDRTDDAGVRVIGTPTGAVWGDYDNDGDPDLFVVTYGWAYDTSAPGAPDLLFRNNGDGHFTEVGGAAGVSGGNAHGMAAAWDDYDHDGLLDLYVGNLGVMNWGAGHLRNETNLLFHNDGDGTFSDATASAGQVTGGGAAPGGGQTAMGMVQGITGEMTMIGSISGDGAGGSGFTYAVLWFDADGDSWDDLMVGNDAGVSPLYHNDRDGTFSLITQSAGLRLAGSAMGLDAGDVDGDGDFDVCQTNYNYNFLWRNDGDLTFREAGRAAGIDDPQVGWSCSFFDYDGDGDLDQFVANGDQAMGMGEMGMEGMGDMGHDMGMEEMGMMGMSHDILFQNHGDGTFADVTADAGLEEMAKSTGAAYADYDNDGDPDLWVGNSDGANALYRNDVRGVHWLRLQLQGTLSNRDAIGATVEVSANGHVQTLQVRAGSAFGSQNSARLQVGLGTALHADSVRIAWPSGIVTLLQDLPVGPLQTIVESTDLMVQAGPSLVTGEDQPVQLHAEVTSKAPQGLTIGWIVNTSSGDVALEGADPSYIFTTPGTYHLSVTATDGSGATATDTLLVVVTDRTAPQVNLTLPPKVLATVTTVYSAKGTVDNDPTPSGGLSYAWNFTLGDKTVKALGQEPKVTLPLTGTWNLTLVVTDRSGNRQVEHRDIVVGYAPPPALPPLQMSLMAAALPLVLTAALIVVGRALIPRSDRASSKRPPAAKPAAGKDDSEE